MYECIRPDDWREYSLFDLALWKNGLAFKNIDFAKSGRPVIKIAELKNGVTSQTALTMAEYDPSVFVRRGDMLFSWSGNPDTSIDVFRWKGEDGWLNQHVFKVIPRTGVSDDFLFFLLKWLKPRFAEIARNKQTTGLGHVTIKDLKQMLVGIPDSREQERIVRIISPIQEKIALNREINETLETMARAIFKDWFVDFGPTRAKMEGHEPYLAPKLWDLFPDRVDDEDKPVGWSVQPASALFEFNPRESVRKGTNAPYLDMAALPTIGPVPNAPSKRGYKSGSKFRDGDTLFARITPCLENGKTAYVFDLGNDVIGAGSTEFIVIRSRAPLSQPVSYLLARDPDFRAHAERSMTGTSGRQRANAESLSRYEITAPADERLWKALGDVIDPVMDRMIANAHESRTLARTRDLLLPKLMSGEIRLAEAAKAIGAVA